MNVVVQNSSDNVLAWKVEVPIKHSPTDNDVDCGRTHPIDPHGMKAISDDPQTADA